MSQSENIIPASFDDFMNPEPETPGSKSEKETLEDRFDRERMEWKGKIRSLSSKLSKTSLVAELMTEIYTERQLALEYYHYLISLLIKVNKAYNKSYSTKYKFYSYESQERFPNESAKNMRILSELGDLKEKREVLDNHSKFMDGTAKTIDNIIFGMKTRVDIEQIARGK
jgi:predicted ATP-binding protein involved in virulence